MDDVVIWNKCSPEVYRAIYNEFRNRLGVHSIAGDIGPVFMTTWGLGDAPVIKSECRKNDDGETMREDPEAWTYYLATAKYLEATDGR